MTKSLRESLNAGSPSLPFGAAAFASSRNAIKRPASSIGGQIKMRNALLGLDQARGNGAPHGVERNLLIRNPLVQCLHLSSADPTFNCLTGRARHGSFHVFCDNATVRT